MPDATNAKTGEIVHVKNPDVERHTLVEYEGAQIPLWIRERERFGEHDLYVFWSKFYKQVIWKYIYDNKWAILYDYDADKMVADADYCDSIHAFLIQKHDRLGLHKQKQKKRRMRNVPNEYVGKYCTVLQAKQWFNIDVTLIDSIQSIIDDKQIILYNMADCWAYKHNVTINIKHIPKTVVFETCKLTIPECTRRKKPKNMLSEKSTDNIISSDMKRYETMDERLKALLSDHKNDLEAMLRAISVLGSMLTM